MSAQVQFKRLGHNFRVPCAPSGKGEAKDAVKSLWDAGPPSRAGKRPMNWTIKTFTAALKTRFGARKRGRPHSVPGASAAAAGPVATPGGERKSAQVQFYRLGHNFRVPCAPSRKGEAADAVKSLWDAGPPR